MAYIQIRNLTPVPDKILGEMVTKYEIHKSKGGVFLTGDRADNHEAIKPRWFRILCIGKNVKIHAKVNDYVLVEHGRWSREFRVKLDNDGNICRDGKIPFAFHRIDPFALIIKAEGDFIENDLPLARRRSDDQ